MIINYVFTFTTTIVMFIQVSVFEHMRYTHFKI